MQSGAAREKQKNYPEAVKAYNKAADRYSDRPQIASDAIYRASMAWNKQSQTAEYDQGASVQAIDSLTDFITLFPDDKRVAESEKTIDSLRKEQARGSYRIARFYEKHKKWQGARIYYNEVLALDPNSPYAPEARQRIDEIRRRIEAQPVK
jgi:outer membrane protein assembly factor BamD (BamD/ComL family)